MVVTWKTVSPPQPPSRVFANVDGRNAVSITMVQSGDHVMVLTRATKLEAPYPSGSCCLPGDQTAVPAAAGLLWKRRTMRSAAPITEAATLTTSSLPGAGQLPVGPDDRPGPCAPSGVVYAYPKDIPPEGAPDPGNLSEAEYLKKLAEYEASQNNRSRYIRWILSR